MVPYEELAINVETDKLPYWAITSRLRLAHITIYVEQANGARSVVSFVMTEFWE